MDIKQGVNNDFKEKSKLEKILRSRMFWSALPILAYLLSFFWFGLSALDIFTIMFIPIGWMGGIGWWLEFLGFNLRAEFVAFLFNIFNVLVVGFFGFFILKIEKFSKIKLYFYSIIFILIFLLTVSGCSRLNYSF